MAWYPNGMTSGSAGHNPAPKKRGRVVGWTPGAVRRHTRWLYSINDEDLDGVGIALTLTMRETPDNAPEFHSLRTAWLKRMARQGALRTHWVIEWQGRGTPHLHCAVYFPDDGKAPALLAGIAIAAWMEIAGDYGVSPSAQWFDEIDGPVGWLKYLSKHASRGVSHYQRTGHPAGWSATGRLWGHGGSWPSLEPMRADLSHAAYHRLRRLVRAYAVAEARKDLRATELNPVRDPQEQAQRLRKARARVKWTRGMLACSDRRLAPVRGVSQWVPEDAMTGLVALLVQEGAGVIGR